MINMRHKLCRSIKPEDDFQMSHQCLKILNYMGWVDVSVDADFVRINIHIISNYVACLIYHSVDVTFVW